MEFIHKHIAVCDLSSEIDFNNIFDCFGRLDDEFFEVSHRTQLTMKIDFYSNEVESKDKSELKSLVVSKVHPLVYEFMENLKIDKGKYIHFPNILSSKMIPGTEMGSHFDPEDAVIYLLYLNDGFVGGDLIFDDLNISFTPTAGKLIIFYSKYKHHVTNLEGKHRYTLSSGFKPIEL